MPTRRLVSATLLVASPALAVLLALVVVGSLEKGTAAGAGIFILAATGVLLARPLGDLSRLGLRVDDLAAGEHDGEPERRYAGPIRDLAAAVAEQRRRVAAAQAVIEARAEAAESVIDSVPEPLLLVDRSYKVVHANLAAETLLGHDLAGRDLGAVLRAPPVIARLAESLNDGRGRAVDFALTQPIERELRARIALLTRSGEAGEAAVVALEDLTAIRRAEEMRVDFVANVSHELKTPVATMIGFIETLQGPARDDATARDRFLGIMGDQARRMERLVEDLLSLSRIELDEHIAPTGKADLVDILQADTDALELVAARRRMRIRLDLPDDLPAVAGDPDQLAQVFRNLIENALKYGREGTDVEIAARVEGAQVRTEIRDHGEGIPRHHIPRLTERFYRVDPARSRAAGGTGLGLAIVKHIVNRHRGTLTIESEVGQGSRFSVRLPVARPAAAFAAKGAAGSA